MTATAVFHHSPHAKAAAAASRHQSINILDRLPRSSNIRINNINNTNSIRNTHILIAARFRTEEFDHPTGTPEE